MVKVGSIRELRLESSVSLVLYTNYNTITNYNINYTLNICYSNLLLDS